MATSFFTLRNMSVKSLCVMIRTAPDARDRWNAAEMLHARVAERELTDADRAAVADMLDDMASRKTARDYLTIAA